MTKVKPQNAPLSKRKKRIFKIAAILTAFFILVLLEISLRVFGYGKNYPLFIQNGDDETRLVINPEAAEK